MSSVWVSAPSDTSAADLIDAASGVLTVIDEPYFAVDGALLIVGRAPLNR